MQTTSEKFQIFDWMVKFVKEKMIECLRFYIKVLFYRVVAMSPMLKHIFQLSSSGVGGSGQTKVAKLLLTGKFF